MPQDTQIKKPFEKKASRFGSPDFENLEQVALRDRSHRRRIQWAIIAALVLHAGLFAVEVRDRATEVPEIEPKEKAVFVVQQVKFKPPAPKPKREIPERLVRRVPVPDPTPDDPEPIRLVEIQTPVFDVPESDPFFSIPDGPPVAPASRPLEIGGEVLPPVKITSSQPGYTEEARSARIQGVVILQAVIDRKGQVTELKPLKGLPMGLTESALATVQQWKFRPATLNGKPVPVFFNFTISFSLQ